MEIQVIDEASFRIPVKLTDRYKIAFEEYKPEEVSIERRIAIVDAVIGINRIDGLVLSEYVL